MKKLLTLFAVLLLASCEKGGEDSWVTLFNGTNLEGWEVKGEDATFAVQDGMVVGTNRGRNNTFLATENRYRDFILELEVWVDPRMNSGIQFRSNQKESGRVYGYQAEVDPSARAYSGGIYDEARRGWLYPLSYNPEGQKAFKNNEWNTYRIEAYGNSIRIWVNGICTAVLEDDMTIEGFIALQVHGVGTKEEEGRQVKWRNARLLTTEVDEHLNPLPPDLYQLNLVTQTLTSHEKQQGWGWLFHEETLIEITNEVVSWSYDGKILSNDTTHQSFMGSNIERKRADFEFSFQYKLAPGASGYFGYLDEKDGVRRYLIHDPETGHIADSASLIEEVYKDVTPQNLSYATMGRQFLKPIGSWNQGRIVVRNNVSQHWMNGFKIAEFPVEEKPDSGYALITLEWTRGYVEFTNLKTRYFE